MIAVAALLTAGFAVAAVAGLRPTAGTDSLVPKAEGASAATDRIRSEFGDDAVIVLAEAKLSDLLLSPDLGRLLKLEGCLGGRVPKGAKPYGRENGPCAAIARSGAVERVYGPGTFLNEAARQVSGQVSKELEQAAAKVQTAGTRARAAAVAQGLPPAEVEKFVQQAKVQAQQAAAADLARLQLQTGIRGLPTIANSEFVSQIAFDGSRGPGQPKTRFAYLFPSATSALIQVRPKAGLTSTQRSRLVANVNAAVNEPDFKLKSGSYRVTGAPVLAESLADEVAAGAIPLLIAAAIAMAIALGLAFRVSFRLLALILALTSTAVVFGGMAILGLPLTVAAVGGVPVLIGLAVDYAVQYQARADEAAGGEPPGGDAVIEAAGSGGVPIVAAAAATSAGFLALLVSPVPMVRGFGLVLIVGVAVAIVVSFTVGSALIPIRRSRSDLLATAADRLDASVRGAGQIIASGSPSGKVGRLRSRAAGAMAANPGRVLAVAAVLAVAGWAVEGDLTVESDITRLVPANTPALQDLQALQDQSGVAGEVDVLTTGSGALTPQGLAWIKQFKEGALERWGYDERKGCRGAELCPGLAITDLIQPRGSAADVRAAIGQTPDYFRRAVVSPDGKSVLTSFGVSLIPLERQQEVFDDLRQRARSAPEGVEVVIGGLPVIAAEANSRLADPVSRLTLTLLALLAVALVLLATLRSARRALVPLAATAVASGWAPLGLWVLGVELNPLSAALGALVIAIGTEFAVLLSERHHAELRAEQGSEQALSRALGTTGRAIRISGLTVITGFAVLWFSDIRVLRDFGLATVIDLGLALAAVAVVVPALLRWLDRRSAEGSEAA
ncbi:MAG: MMPL family transporter [Actinomycetes bacterium]